MRYVCHVLLATVVWAGETPDFAGTLYTQKLVPASGKRPVLAVLWDPHRDSDPAPKKEDVERLLFGPRPSVADWYRENSGGKVEIVRAGCLGWYDADKPGEHYWAADEGDKDGDGWVSGHNEKWAEAIRKAALEIDLASFDADNDAILAPTELAILVVVPQNGPFGTNRAPAGREAPTWQPLVVDGMTIPVIAEWYTGAPPNLGAPAHELAHLVLGAPDLYMTASWAYAAGTYSIMDCSYWTVHLDPFEKLKLGWLQPRVVEASGEVALKDVETTGEALILWDPSRGHGEYLIVENRWRGESYDAGVEGAGGGLRQDGLAVWHVVEDPALLAKCKPPTGGEGDWGRCGIRLVRANGGDPVDDSKALLDREGASLSDSTRPARLSWVDGGDTGIEVTLLTPPGREVRLKVTIPANR